MRPPPSRSISRPISAAGGPACWASGSQGPRVSSVATIARRPRARRTPRPPAHPRQRARCRLPPVVEQEQWLPRLVIELTGRRSPRPAHPWVYVGSSARCAEAHRAAPARHRSARLSSASRCGCARPLRGPARVPGSKTACRAESERAHELAGCGFVAHRRDLLRQGAGGLGRCDAERLEPVGHRATRPPRQLYEASFGRSTPSAAHGSCTGSAASGSRVHRPARSAARLWPLRARAARRAGAPRRRAGALGRHA